MHPIISIFQEVEKSVTESLYGVDDVVILEYFGVRSKGPIKLESSTTSGRVFIEL